MSKPYAYGPEICQQCGGPRSWASGKRCLKCYRRNSAKRREPTLEGAIINELLIGEHRGEFVQKPVDLWQLSPWHRRQQSGKDGGR